MQSGHTKYGIGMTVSACLWLGLFPVMQFGTYATITRDKWLCMLILTGVSVLCFMTDLICRCLSRPRPLSLIAGSALLLCMIISSLTSPYPGAPWWIGAGRREGLASQLCYLGLFFLFSFSRVRKTPVLISAGAGLCAFLIVVLLQRAGGNPLGLYPAGYSYENTPLFQGTIGNVDMCCGYLLIMCGIFLPALVGNIRKMIPSLRKKEEGDLSVSHSGKITESLPVRLLSALVLVFFLIACVWLFITMDVRLSLLSFAVLLVWTLIRFLPKAFRLPVLLVLIAVILVFAWYYTGQNSTLYELHEVLHGRIQYGFGSNRVGVWSYCAKLLAEGDHLLFGTGPDTFALRFNDFLERYFTENPRAERLRYYYDNPHSEYIAMLMNCGIPAMLFFLILVIGGCFGAAAWRDTVLCYGIQALLSFSVCLIAPMFWVVLGMSWSLSPGRIRNREKTAG